jgi:predicted nucleic-acid-binding protein
MRAVDTNVLVRLVTRDDTKQLAVAETFVAHGAWVPTLVLAEAVWVLATVYDLDGAQTAKAVAMLLEHDKLVIESADAVAAALALFEKKSKALCFSDCLVLELSRKAGHLPLGTFDRALGKLQGTERL